MRPAHQSSKLTTILARIIRLQVIFTKGERKNNELRLCPSARQKLLPRDEVGMNY